MHWFRVIVATCIVLTSAAAAALLPLGAVTPGEAAVTLALATLPLALGAVLAWRRPRHPAGALLATAGLALVLTMLPGDVADSRFAGGWMLLFLPFASLLLRLPDGRLPSRRWRFVAVGLPATVAIFVGLNAALWYTPSVALTAVALVDLFAFFALLIAAAASVIVRYRRSDSRQQVQLRWIFVAGASLPLTLLLCWASFLLLGVPDLVVFGLLAMYVAIPTATAIAILRPGWLDVDRIAVATVSVAALSVAVLAILTVAGVAASLALVEISPSFAIAVSIGITLLAIPLYRRARRTFGHLLYPARERALVALRELSARVDAGTASPERIEEILRTALRDPQLQIRYRSVVSGALVGFDGQPASDGPATVMRLRGEEIGVIIAAATHIKAPPAEVAAAAAPLVQAVRMRAELTLALGELTKSRERILRAGYEERRRLERDLHDGAQQRLVALGMALRVLQRTRPDADAITDSLDVAVAELGTAVAELRQIAQGMRPSALDDGLAPALANLVRLSPTPVELDIRTGALPDAVGTTAYFVASEAVANAVKHADAARIRVEITQRGSELRVLVSDDGRGGAVLRPTAGLTGLHDRVAALGGSLSVDSPVGLGTTVEVLLPCES